MLMILENAIRVFLTMVYVLAILYGEFDRRKWWCYLVMVLSIIFIWN